ncbi:MAG: hypothetical protein VKL59_10580 [Nostocaceae cyanobacterium]|nr:hypothetical protein [Nostocaceae cyanobacterium]
MGFFSWLGGLLDELIAWLGRAFLDFINNLLEIIEAVWYTAIATVLLAAFGAATTLYVIFSAGRTLTETLMEIWDPRYENKPSQVFSIEKAPGKALPKKRSEVTTVLELKNLQY